ncbi:bacteriocin immunity protein [Neobacillus massiliamazoniensis]|uniref:Enterocin A Immunity n=1 Tax=Neobacillus massiliamazoniensis TaxID=1499688 RepID=A0A0U1P2T3_9BACI|nr:bacteriocin immunity protein [Neobacillus massiliamazoniensis]CRK84576.1 Enterocin A Immunity [Neobacillus massiliamazoniensis]
MSAKNKLKIDEQKVLNDIYDLVLDPNTLEQERNVLLSCKNSIEKGGNLFFCIRQLQKDLRPFAIKLELSTKVSKYYVEISNYKTFDRRFSIGFFW